MLQFTLWGMDQYTFWGKFGYYATIVSVIFYYHSKSNAMGVLSRAIVFYTSKFNKILGTGAKIFLACFESYLAVRVMDMAIGNFNRSFGDFTGTGANYFGMLLTILFLWILLSLLLLVNPLKMLDISTMYLPFHLIFIKLSCFCTGCCHGIPWEHGLYNANPNYLGYQVPVQLIEAFWGLLIFIFFLWYRKRAKTGTMFPIYLILYSATRFISEFFRPEENVLGPLKMYHILCLVAIAYGAFHLAFLHYYGKTINETFDNLHRSLDDKFAQIEAQEQAKLLAEKEKERAEQLARQEKAKAARAKAKKRKK